MLQSAPNQPTPNIKAQSYVRVFCFLLFSYFLFFFVSCLFVCCCFASLTDHQRTASAQHLSRVLSNLRRSNPAAGKGCTGTTGTGRGRGNKASRTIPTHFVHIPVTSAAVLQAISAVAAAMTAANPALADTLVGPHRSHVTLCTLVLASKHDEALAARVLREAQHDLIAAMAMAMASEAECGGCSSGGSGSDGKAEVVGLRSFGNRVVYAAVRSAAIGAVQQVVEARLRAAGIHVCEEDRGENTADNEFVAHITVAKLNSQMMRGSGGGVTSIPPHTWQHMADSHMGSFAPAAVHLCEMPWMRVPHALPKCEPYHICDSVSLQLPSAISASASASLASASSLFPAAPLAFPSPPRHRLVIFDFDSTLFCPLVPSEALWTAGALRTIRKDLKWFERSELIDMQLEHSGDACLVEANVCEARKWMALAGMAGSGVTTALVTGRTEQCRDAVGRVLLRAELAFTHMYFRPVQVPTLEYKLGVVSRLVARITGSQAASSLSPSASASSSSSSSSSVVVEIFDDNERFLQAAAQQLGRGVAVVHNAKVVSGSANEAVLQAAQELEVVRTLSARELRMVPRVSYSAVVLDAPSKERLVRAFPAPKGWDLCADHVTLVYGAAVTPAPAADAVGSSSSPSPSSCEGNHEAFSSSSTASPVPPALASQQQQQQVQLVVDGAVMTDRVLAVRVSLLPRV